MKCANIGVKIGNFVMETKKAKRSELYQALSDDRIRFALIVDAEGYAIQAGEKSPPDTWFISQEVPDKFVESFKNSPRSIEIASAIYKVAPDITVLSVVLRIDGWEHITLLPLLGDTVVQLLRASASSGLRVQFNADEGDVAMRVTFEDEAELSKALNLAELRSDANFTGHEPLAVLYGALGELESKSKAMQFDSPNVVNVLAAAVELPETMGAMTFLQRQILGPAEH